MAKAYERRDGEEEERELYRQRVKLSDLARESLEACGGESSVAAERLSELLESDPDLLRQVVRAVCDEVADQFARRIVRERRAAVVSFANRVAAKGSATHPGHFTARDESNAITSAVLDMPLFNNVPLRDAKRTQVTKFAEFMGNQGRPMLQKEAFLLKIVDLLPEETSRVKDYVSEDQAQGFWNEVA